LPPRSLTMADWDTCLEVKRAAGWQPFWKVKSTGPPALSDRLLGGRTEEEETRGKSVRRLASVQARAFQSAGGSAPRPLFLSTAVALVGLEVYEWRAHPSGRAVCLLWLRPLRCLGWSAALALLICAVGVVSAPAGAAVAAALAVLALSPAVRAVRAGPARRRLSALTPPGPHVYVHSLASTLPGAGAELLRALTEEADENGWSLVLDASNEKLAQYYRDFGFVAAGEGVEMPGGGSHIRMWRRARVQDES